MADNIIYGCFDRTRAALKKMKRIYVNREWRQSAFPRIKSGVRRDRLRLAKPLRRERTYRNGLARQAEASLQDGGEAGIRPPPRAKGALLETRVRTNFARSRSCLFR